MITTFVVASVLATVILAVNPRNPSLRWLSASLYVGSFMIFVFILDLKEPDAPNLLVNSMFFVADVALAFSFGMFGLVYSELIDQKRRRRWMAVGLLLIGIAWLLTPLSPTRRINYEGYNELPVVIFVNLALGVGVVLLLLAHAREKHPYKRIERLLTNLLIVPTMLCIMTCYIFYAFDIDLFQYNYLFAIAFLAVFLLIGAKRGVLGVKIKLEMLKADASIQVLQGSASLVNHAIKNEMGKIDILLHQLGRTIQAPDRTAEARQREAESMLALATESVHHVQSMMTRINERLQVIEVDLKKADIMHTLEPCLETLAATYGPNVRLVRQLKPAGDVYHDPTHMKEVFNNLLLNAVEAMEYRGSIAVSTEETEKEVVVRIQDSGGGIPREALSSIFEPFYSTKRMTSHSGLGLFYCRNVMVKHNGSIHVDSIAGKGSSFSIRLPK